MSATRHKSAYYHSWCLRCSLPCRREKLRPLLFKLLTGLLPIAHTFLDRLSQIDALCRRTIEAAASFNIKFGHVICDRSDQMRTENDHRKGDHHLRFSQANGGLASGPSINSFRHEAKASCFLKSVSRFETTLMPTPATCEARSTLLTVRPGSPNAPGAAPQSDARFSVRG